MWLLLQALNLCRLLAEHCPGDEDDERPERHKAEYDARVAKHQECGFLGGSLRASSGHSFSTTSRTSKRARPQKEKRL